MLRTLAFMCAFAFATMPVLLHALETINVSAEADQYAVAGKPIAASVTITHDSAQKIDPGSFRLEGKPLPVTFSKEVRFSPRSSLVLSIYHFTIEPKKEGLHFLKPITVKIDGKEYTSDESSYQVSQSYEGY